mgnify:CR=1 FL=1
MELWFLAIILFFYGTINLIRLFFNCLERLSGRKNKLELQNIVDSLQDIKEIIESGLVPPDEKWMRLGSFQEPWGGLIQTTLSELRSQGAPVLPTVDRIKKLAQENIYFILNSQSKTAQALVQSLCCLFMTMLVGGGLYILMPGLEFYLTYWTIACFFSLFISSLGVFWLVSMSETASWGGVHLEYRSWILFSQCSGERLIAYIRSGMTPELAWCKSYSILLKENKRFAQVWGQSVWSEKEHHISKQKNKIDTTIVFVIKEMVKAFKKSIHLSLMDGSPCIEKIESALEVVAKEIKIQTEKEVSLLSSRALKPLFICVAPALMGLLIFGIYLNLVDLKI